MASHTRARSGTLSGPHSISLKVLRLSRPSLATQTPLPHTSFGNGVDISPKASLAYSSADEASSFPLTPLLTLPAAFGAAYVGETFSCTLCANNELAAESSRKSVSGVKITAELQTPSHPEGLPLQLEKAEHGQDEEGEGSLKAGATLQRSFKHEMQEEGPYVLVVTVTYTETLHTSSGEAATSGRARTFRKLYQFVSQQLLAVRSKITERKRRSADSARQWVLEAQLENVGEASVVLERVWLKEREGVKSKELRADSEKGTTILKPQDVEQVMFVLEDDTAAQDTIERITLAQLNIDWRSAMGEKGSLTTGWLASRGK